MRKTLLIAAAALAAGVISSQAQVYSQNIVGYVNVPCPAGFTAVGNPLNNANGNSITNVMPNIPDLSLVYVWNGVSYDTFLVYGGLYYDSTGSTELTPPNVPIGTGLFVQASSAFTNTFVGTAMLTNGPAGTISTNILNIPAGFAFVNSQLPIGGGLISNLQMANIPDLTQVFTWVSGGWSSALSYGGAWYDLTGSVTVPEPTVTPGSAFFINPPSPFAWTMLYTNQ